jgi:hypothetical protein
MFHECFIEGSEAPRNANNSYGDRSAFLFGGSLFESKASPSKNGHQCVDASTISTWESNITTWLDFRLLHGRLRRWLGSVCPDTFRLGLRANDEHLG